MNEERLKKLKERANQAVKVAAEIINLQKASPFGCYVDLLFRQENKDVWPDELLKDVIEAGRLALLKQKETLLESLVTTEPEPDSIAMGG
jgi:hypothetical protein